MSSAPPKPKWETSSAPNATASSSKLSLADTSSGALASVSTRDSDSAPRIPDRPAELGNNALSTPGYSAMQTNPYQSRMGMGASGYGGYGGGVSSYGGYGGGYGGYGSAGGYGGMSRMGGGYGGYGMGGYGVGNMGGPGEGLPNLTSSLQQSTAPAFAIIESLVTAFTSLAQLVESTYMATHSSFFAMVGVADQLGSVKSYLGQVLGVFSILRLGRRMIAWIKGQKAETINQTGWANEWSSGVKGIGGRSGGGTGPSGEKRPSSKPLLLFLLSAVGLPYLMSRLVRLLIRHQQEQQAALAQSQGQGQLVDGVPLDPSKLTFARAKWEFKAGEEWELSLGRDEIVAVLEARGGAGAGQGQGGEDERGWWRGRTRDGRAGWFPGNYVEVIRRKEGSDGK